MSGFGVQKLIGNPGVEQRLFIASEHKDIRNPFGSCPGRTADSYRDFWARLQTVHPNGEGRQEVRLKRRPEAFLQILLER